MVPKFLLTENKIGSYRVLRVLLELWGFDSECLSWMRHGPHSPPVLSQVLKVRFTKKHPLLHFRQILFFLKTLPNRAKDLIKVGRLGFSQVSDVYIRWIPGIHLSFGAISMFLYFCTWKVALGDAHVFHDSVSILYSSGSQISVCITRAWELVKTQITGPCSQSFLVNVWDRSQEVAFPTSLRVMLILLGAL